MKAQFGELLKQLRIKSGKSLRDFCVENGFDPGNYSRLERGLSAPPHEAKIAEYARALGIEVGSDVYINLLDRAFADRGELPRDLLLDEQLVAELPVLFRTLRGKPVEEEKMNKLIELMRKR
jgi:transcriptional regulator with XRE-family HTH domain